MLTNHVNLQQKSVQNGVGLALCSYTFLYIGITQENEDFQSAIEALIKAGLGRAQENVF